MDWPEHNAPYIDFVAQEVRSVSDWDNRLTDEVTLEVRNDLEALWLPILWETHKELLWLRWELNGSEWPDEVFFNNNQALEPFVFTAKIDNSFSTNGAAPEVWDDWKTGSATIGVSKWPTACTLDYKVFTQRYDQDIETNPMPNVATPATMFESKKIEWLALPEKFEMPDGYGEAHDRAWRTDVLQLWCTTEVFEYHWETFTTTLKIWWVAQFEWDFWWQELQNMIHSAIGAGTLDLDYTKSESRLGITGEVQFERFYVGGVTFFITPGFEVYDNSWKIYLKSKVEKRSGNLILDLTGVIWARENSDNTVIQNAMKTWQNYWALSTWLTLKASPSIDVTFRTWNNEFDSKNFYVDLLFTKSF